MPALFTRISIAKFIRYQLNEIFTLSSFVTSSFLHKGCLPENSFSLVHLISMLVSYNSDSTFSQKLSSCCNPCPASYYAILLVNFISFPPHGINRSHYFFIFQNILSYQLKCLLIQSSMKSLMKTNC